jgi:anti-sigma B factor antagonist
VAAALNRIEVERADAAAAVVRLGGEHDLSSAPQLNQELEELIAEQRSVVVDLAHATFVDSSILAALLEARESSAEAGLELRLFMPDVTAPAVRRVVELTGLKDAVTTEEPGEVAAESVEPAS